MSGARARGRSCPIEGVRVDLSDLRGREIDLERRHPEFTPRAAADDLFESFVDVELSQPEVGNRPAARSRPGLV